jgi:hypothetical protein
LEAVIVTPCSTIGKMNKTYKIQIRKPQGQRPIERHNVDEDNIKMAIK